MDSRTALLRLLCHPRNSSGKWPNPPRWRRPLHPRRVLRRRNRSPLSPRRHRLLSLGDLRLPRLAWPAYPAAARPAPRAKRPAGRRSLRNCHRARFQPGLTSRPRRRRISPHRPYRSLALPWLFYNHRSQKDLAPPCWQLPRRWIFRLAVPTFLSQVEKFLTGLFTAELYSLLSGSEFV